VSVSDRNRDSENERIRSQMDDIRQVLESVLNQELNVIPVSSYEIDEFSFKMMRLLRSFE
jgi:hypothetical protein